MGDQIVIDTGPLVSFGRAELLDIVGGLPFEFISPDEVFEELEQGAAAGYPRVEPRWLKRMSLSSPIDRVANLALDMGETAVIQLALERGIRRVCIDERKGRLAAQWVNLEVIGSLGLLIRAKKQGLLPLLRPHLEKLGKVGIYYHESLVHRVLEAVGEADTVEE